VKDIFLVNKATGGGPEAWTSNPLFFFFFFK
jgi:hypothetical protein